mgnify:CR=1 FL=1
MRLFLIFIIAASGLVGCQKDSGATKSSASLKPRYFLDSISGNDDYADVFDRYTKMDRSHSEFLPVIMAYATLWGSDLREAYIREMAGRFRLDEDAEKKLATQELQENESFIVFILSVGTREPEWNELDRQNSIWRITLESEDGSVQDVPERVEVISQKDERAKYFYKRMDSFTRTYRLRFARDKFSNVSPVKLYVVGVRGKMEFSFPNDSVTPGVGAR